MPAAALRRPCSRRARLQVTECSNAQPPRIHLRSLARGERARRHRDFVLGRAVLSAGAHGAADRGRSWLVALVRDGRVFLGPARRRPVFALCRRRHRSLRRPCGDAGRLACSAPRASPRLVHAQSAPAYFAVWMVLGVAMAASLYDPAFATLGRIFGAGARGADHDADARRRFCLHRELAGDAIPHRQSRLARHLSGLCRACWRLSPRRCTLSRCRASAPRFWRGRQRRSRRRKNPRRSFRRTG